MPIYEYHCQTCGKKFDKLIRSINRIPKEIACPNCDSIEVQRLISAPTIRTGGETASGEVDVADSTSSGTEVFGRKELQAAEKKKAELKERAKYNDWD